MIYKVFIFTSDEVGLDINVQFEKNNMKSSLDFKINAGGYDAWEYETGYFDKNDIDKDYTISSYYAMGSFFITGEHRPYKHGAFGRVKPKKDIDNGGFGALELVARYSSMGASQDVVDANPGLPTQINNVSVGMNWYLTAHARIMYNYIITDDKNDTLGNLSGHLIRVQIDF